MATGGPCHKEAPSPMTSALGLLRRVTVSEPPASGSGVWVPAKSSIFVASVPAGVHWYRLSTESQGHCRAPPHDRYGEQSLGSPVASSDCSASRRLSSRVQMRWRPGAKIQGLTARTFSSHQTHAFGYGSQRAARELSG